MFAGIHGDKRFLRLSDSGIANIMKDCKEVSVFEPMPGRAMKGYVVLPKLIYSNDKLFAEWLDKSINYPSSIPPNQEKKK